MCLIFNIANNAEQLFMERSELYRESFRDVHLLK